MSRNDKNYKAKRERALERAELRQPSEPRAPVGLTSFPIKVEDPETRKMIDSALAERLGR